jgi:hypothetical protein
MKNDDTHITVILDRTGSMEALRDDPIGGFNAFLRQQKAEPGFATLTLVPFDSQDPYEVVHPFKAWAAVPELTRKTFVPRASTPTMGRHGPRHQRSGKAPGRSAGRGQARAGGHGHHHGRPRERQP